MTILGSIENIDRQGSHTDPLDDVMCDEMIVFCNTPE